MAPPSPFELGGGEIRDGLDLLLRDVVACNEHAFIERHVWSLWLGSARTGMVGRRTGKPTGTTLGIAGALPPPRQGRRAWSTNPPAMQGGPVVTAMRNAPTGLHNTERKATHAPSEADSESLRPGRD